MLTYTYLTVCGKTSSYIRNMFCNKYHYQISWLIYGSKLFGMYLSFKYPSNVRSGCANTPFLPRDTLYHVTYIYTLSRTVHGRSFCCFDKAYSEIGIFVLFFFLFWSDSFLHLCQLDYWDLRYLWKVQILFNRHALLKSPK